MEIEQLDGLLLQIKKFLANNKYLEGAFNLLARLDAYLDKKISKNNNTEEFQIILDSDDEINKISPRKFANIIDIFVLDFNFQSNTYQITPFLQQKYSDTKNDRNAIYQLFLCPIKEHCIQKQKTHSMTQLHRLTSNIPKSLPCLILPNYSSDISKYIYVFETKQCMEEKNKYYLVDRYYCFVMDALANEGLQLLFRQFRNRVFQERITKVDDPIEVNWKCVRDSLRSVIPILVDKVNQIPLKINQPFKYVWTQQQVQYVMPFMRTTFISSLTLLITYFAIISKQQKHRLSDIMLSIEGSLNPLKYVYPIVFCSLNKNHCDFVESPVPLTIGFWGSQKRRQKFTAQIRQIMKQIQDQNGIPTIVINLQTNQIVCQSQIKNSDIYIIQRLHKYINKYGKGDMLWQKLSHFLQQNIQQIKEGKDKKQQNQWVSLLQQKVMNSQMYHHLKGQ